MLVRAKIKGSALGSGSAVDVLEEILPQATDDFSGQTGQRGGVNAFIDGWAGSLQSQLGAQLVRRQGIGILAAGGGIHGWRIQEQGISLDELVWIGVGEVIVPAVVQLFVIYKVAAVLELLIRVAIVPGIDEIVNVVHVLGVTVDNFADARFLRIEGVFVAGVVDDPDIRHHIGLNASSPVFVHVVIGNEGRRRIGGAVVVPVV